MIDLLEKDDRRKITAEYRVRYISVALFAVGLVGVIALVVVGSVYGAQRIEARTLRQSLTQFEQSKKLGTNANYVTDLAKANSSITRLTTDKNSLRRVSMVLDELARFRPAGIRISGVNLERGTGQGWLVRLAGQAARRQDILTYVEALKKQTIFTSVESPLSNLVKEANSDFALVLSFQPSSR
ncbi:MAG: hypothetical protein NTY66_03035 [Candidatus Vogelbacteria bacterium]|nr:hypothetical protein [Candidatus Vogelbacteria bacterium]